MGRQGISEVLLDDIFIDTPSPVVLPASLLFPWPFRLWLMHKRSHPAGLYSSDLTWSWESPARCNSERLVQVSPGLWSVAVPALEDPIPILGSQSKQKGGHQAAGNGKRPHWWFSWLEYTSASTTQGWDRNPATQPWPPPGQGKLQVLFRSQGLRSGIRKIFKDREHRASWRWVGNREGPPPQERRETKALISLEAAPYRGESSSSEMTLEDLAWGHESI